MNCDWIRANTALYIYDELPDDQRHELEIHLSRCAACAAEAAELRQLQGMMSVLERPEPSPNLLASSRMRLQEALEHTEQAGGWRRWTFDFAGWMHQIKLAPALALVLMMVGFSGGMLTNWQMNRGNGTLAGLDNATSNAPAEASIAGIRAILPDASGKGVEIKYDTLQPRTVQGNVDDPNIQQLLLYAARNNYNSGVRIDSIDLLRQHGDDARVREALMYALRYDTNPGVRLKALDGLRDYAREDVRVRDALLEALLTDSNPGVRSEAIQILRGSRADTSVRQTLQMLSQQDENDYIRGEARRLLATLPEID